MTPEQSLWRDMLHHAFNDLDVMVRWDSKHQGPPQTDTEKSMRAEHIRNARSAVIWIEGDVDEAGGFRWVCDAIGYRPDPQKLEDLCAMIRALWKQVDSVEVTT
jgi:hypothetical protein